MKRPILVVCLAIASGVILGHAHAVAQSLTPAEGPAVDGSPA